MFPFRCYPPAPRLGRGFSRFSLFLFKQLKQLTHFVPLLCFLCPGPGINLAESSLWLACAMALAVLDIKKYVDEFGNVVEPNTRRLDGTIT